MNETPLQMAKKIFFNEYAQMLNVVHENGACNWKTIWKSLYGTNKNFDMFKALAGSRQLIHQTIETRNAKTAKGVRKFMVNSLSDKAMYECTDFGNLVRDELMTCKNSLAFVAGMKKWRHEIKEGMTKYEFLMRCDIVGCDVFSDDFFTNEISPELQTTSLGKLIITSLLSRRNRFFNLFNAS